MKIHDSFKGYKKGVGKVIPPRETFRITYQKLTQMKHPILANFFKVKNRSNIPQYRFRGNVYYKQIVLGDGANGKGHGQYLALASGIMELVERYSCLKFLRDRKNSKIASFRQMQNRLFKAENIYSNYIEAVHRDNIFPMHKKVLDADVLWFKAYTLQGKQLYLPQNLIRFLLQGSNGMASGNSLEEALLHGICEVIERHSLSLVFINKLEVPSIELTTIDNFIARDLIKKFKILGDQIYIKDFSLGISIPVIAVIRKVDRLHSMITVGVATNPTEALIRALTENAQGEGEENCLLSSDIDYLFSNKKTIKMHEINNVENNNIKIEVENIEKY